MKQTTKYSVLKDGATGEPPFQISHFADADTRVISAVVANKDPSSPLAAFLLRAGGKGDSYHIQTYAIPRDPAALGRQLTRGEIAFATVKPSALEPTDPSLAFLKANGVPLTELARLANDDSPATVIRRLGSTGLIKPAMVRVLSALADKVLDRSLADAPEAIQYNRLEGFDPAAQIARS